jgi:alpha-tubulin suppressor-like RCC1 family protein
MKNFDLISYLVYFKSELTEEERNQKTVIETLHSRYNHKFTSKHSYVGFKKMKIEIDGESKLDGDGQITFTKDPEGKILLKSLSKMDIDKNEKSFDVNGKSFYIHYPYNPHRIKCWGYGYNYKLGNNECYNTTSSPIYMQNMTFPVKMLKQANSYTIALTEEGKLWRCGYRDQWNRSIYYMEEYSGEVPEEKIIDVRAGTNNYAVLTESHKIYIQGSCNSYHLENGTAKSHLWHKVRPNEEEEKVLNWDVGYDYHVYTTDNGKCYAAGNELLRGLGLENNTKDYKEITFDEGVIPIKPLCTNYYESTKATLMFVKNKDKLELWSAGQSSYGLIGQGDGKNESKTFAPLNYDKETINFVSASLYTTFAMAVTDKGELYGWGNNGSRQLGFTDYSNRYSPTEITFFKDYYVHEVQCGQGMSLICASPRADMEKRQTFVMGDVKGVDTSGVTSEGIVHLKDFDNIKYKWMVSREDVCYVGFEGEDHPTDNVSIHTGYTCEITKKSPIVGTMHFWKVVSYNFINILGR